MNSSSSASSSLSSDTINSSRIPSLITNHPPLFPIPITPSLNTTPTHTSQIQAPTQTPQTSPIAFRTQKSLTITISDTEIPLDPFVVTPTHPPPATSRHTPDPSDIDPILLRNINKPRTRKNLLFLPPSKTAVGTLHLILLSRFLNLAPALNLDILFPLLNFYKSLFLNLSKSSVNNFL